VIRVHACRPRGLGLDSWRYKLFSVAMGLKPVPLALVSINEELLERKIGAPV
jgi:hypothetical protein